MAEAGIDKIVESISTLSAMELADLSKAIQDKFGVTAAAPVMMGGPAAGAAGAEAVEENGWVTGLRISSPENEPSPEMSRVAATCGVSLELGKPHLLEVFCDSKNSGEVDMRPDLPLVIYR